MEKRPEMMERTPKTAKGILYCDEQNPSTKRTL
jgi:hypothetical protein